MAIVVGFIPTPEGEAALVRRGMFRCADAELVIEVGSESLWRWFAAVVEIDPDREDIADSVQRVAVADQLREEIDKALASRFAAEILAALDEAGVPAGQIRTLPEVYDVELDSVWAEPSMDAVAAE